MYKWILYGVYYWYGAMLNVHSSLQCRVFSLDLTAAFDNVDHQQRLCLQHQHADNNPSLSLQLYTEQTSQSSFSRRRIQKRKGENRSGTRRSSVSSALQLLSGRLSNTAAEHQVRRWHYHLLIRTRVADIINDFSIYLSQMLNYINDKKTDSVNGQIYSNTFSARYSRAPPISSTEAGRPSTRKEAKSDRTDARHPAHFHTTLSQYRRKSAATQ